MEDLIAIAEKKLLVEVVKLAQRKGMQGTKGGWKEFLKCYDRKFGTSLSDPAKRSIEVLSAFLKTLDKVDDVKLLAKVAQCLSNRYLVGEATANCPDNESPEQRLVRLTLEHPQYPLEYSFSSFGQDWVITKLSKISNGEESDNKMVAVDCEMVLCEDGTDAVVKVCVVDSNLQVKLNVLVIPNKTVADYRTEITGITSSDLDGVTCTLVDVQKIMSKLLSNGTILIGHSLSNDLQALKIDHTRVIDTSFIFKYSDGLSNRRPSLNNLCKSVLGYEVRKKDVPHNCLDDACAAMKLVLAKIERQLGDTISIIEEDVPQIEMDKLLLHWIPINVPSQELQKVMPGNFTLEVKPSKKAQSDKYSAFAIFKDSEEANQAYESIEGSQEKDSCGRPQKLVKLGLNTGIVVELYVRKMAQDDCLGKVLPRKRVLVAGEDPGDPKKLKTEQNSKAETMASSNKCCDHHKEIERLKQELRNKDFEICKLSKMVSKYRKDKKKKRHGQCLRKAKEHPVSLICLEEDF